MGNCEGLWRNVEVVELGGLWRGVGVLHGMCEKMKETYYSYKVRIVQTD